MNPALNRVRKKQYPSKQTYRVKQHSLSINKACHQYTSLVFLCLFEQMFPPHSGFRFGYKRKKKSLIYVALIQHRISRCCFKFRSISFLSSNSITMNKMLPDQTKFILMRLISQLDQSEMGILRHPMKHEQTAVNCGHVHPSTHIQIVSEQK